LQHCSNKYRCGCTVWKSCMGWFTGL